MATNFQKTLWSARLLANLMEQSILTQSGVVNRDYEGEAREGGTVKINKLGKVTIGNYAGTDIGSPEKLTSSQMTLTIDQSKYFNFMVDELEKIGVDVNLIDEATKLASAQLADVADQFVAGLYVNAHADNLIGTDLAPVTVDETNVYNQIVGLGTKLNLKKVPKAGRFVVVSPAIAEKLLLSGKLTQATVQGEDAIRNGVIGRVAGFDVIETSNAAATANSDIIMAGHPMAISYADGLEKIASYSPEGFFADAVKGLHVYGAKVVVPEALAVIFADK